MFNRRLELGKASENLAVDYLKGNGYRVIKKNYRSRTGEIDIIAREKGVICFVEVKSRSCDNFGNPAEAVSNFKQKQIAKAAICYLKEKKLLDREARFDVVAVTYSDNKPQFNLIKNAFELDSNYLY